MQVVQAVPNAGLCFVDLRGSAAAQPAYVLANEPCSDLVCPASLLLYESCTTGSRRKGPQATSRGQRDQIMYQGASAARNNILTSVKRRPSLWTKETTKHALAIAEYAVLSSSLADPVGRRVALADRRVFTSVSQQGILSRVFVCRSA